MQKYNVQISPEALDDIVNISNYIHIKSRNKFISMKIYNLLISSCNSLEIFPQIYQVIFDNIRRLTIKSYSIFYEIYENKREIIIYRVLWSSQDFTKISFK